MEYRPNPFCQLLRILVLSFIVWSSPSAFSEGYQRSKLGVDIEAFKPNSSQNVGWLTGLRWARYLGDSQAYWGLTAFFGTPNGRALTSEYLTFGGVQFGWEMSVAKRATLEWDISVGYGQGEIKGADLKQNSYYVVQPGIAIGFKLGQGWKALFSTHYLHMSDAPDFSGASFGLRLEFKSQSNSKYVND